MFTVISNGNSFATSSSCAGNGGMIGLTVFDGERFIVEDMTSRLLAPFQISAFA